MNFFSFCDQPNFTSTEANESLDFPLVESREEYTSPHEWSIDQDLFLQGGIMPPIPEDLSPQSQFLGEAGYSSHPVSDPSADIGLGLDLGLAHVDWPSSFPSYANLPSNADYSYVAPPQAVSPLCLSPAELLSLSSPQEVARSFEQLRLSGIERGPTKTGRPTISRLYSSSSGTFSLFGSEFDLEGETEHDPSTAGGSITSHSHSLSSSPSPSLSFSSGYDVDGEMVEDGSESDFVPPPPTTTRRRRYSPYVFERARRFASRAETSSPDANHCSPVRVGTRTRSRNVQVDVLPEQFEQALRSGSRTCPTCGFVPANRRVPDLRRHMDTHCADVSHQKWVCCGVPLEKASAYDAEGDTYIYKGHEMVGGCLKSFSRRDALIRHLDNGKMGCSGTADLAEELSEL